MVAVDDTLERRKGKKISKKRCYRDAVRSTQSLVQYAWGLRWITVMVLRRFPWCDRWVACPVMTVLTWTEQEDKDENKKNELEADNGPEDAEKSKQKSRGKGAAKAKRPKAKTTIQWAAQIIQQLTRAAGDTPLTVVADGGYCVLDLVQLAWSQGITFVSRLRMDAAIYRFTPEHSGGRGRPRVKGDRLCTPREMFKREGLPWESHVVQGYGGKTKELELLSFTCLWAPQGRSPTPVRVV